MLLILALLSSVSFCKTYEKKDVEVKNSIHYDLETKKPITGKVLYYNKDRKIYTEAEFQEGKLNGKMRSYYENGKIQKEVSAKNGIPKGTAKEYYKTGELKGQGTFKKGKMVGEALGYYKDGKVESRAYFDYNGELKEANGYYKDGTIKFKTVRKSEDIYEKTDYSKAGKVLKVTKFGGQKKEVTVKA